MHDHLRDLGRDLAGRHTPCRVWHPEQIIDIQKQTTGGMSIRGIDWARFQYTDEPLHHRRCLERSIELIGISNRCFGSPPPSSLGLKLFTGTEERFIRNFGTPSEDPICLCLNEFKGRKLQSWSLRNLRILKLTGASNLRELWNNSDECGKLEQLPNQITHQVCLRVLFVNRTGIRELPSDIGELRKLEVLEIGSLFLASLPSSLGNLSSLTRLSILSTRVSTISMTEDSCSNLDTLTLINNDHLMDIQTLPTSLRSLKVYGCKMLKKIMGLRGLANLQFLIIRWCSELYELPSFADLHSIKEVSVEDCNKVVKIEGLENSRSLETLEAVTWWKSQVIQSLEGMEKLKKLVMVAENRSALQPCIQTIKKWPDELWIGGRAVSGAESIMGSLSFPTLTTSRSLKKSLTCVNEWRVDCGKTHTSDAAVACFFVNSFGDFALYLEFGGRSQLMRGREGKWVLVGVLRQGCAADVSVTAYSFGGGGEVKRGMLLVGEEGRVLEAFTHLWALCI